MVNLSLIFYKVLNTSPASGGSASRTPSAATPLHALLSWTSLPPPDEIPAGANAIHNSAEFCFRAIHSMRIIFFESFKTTDPLY